MNIEVFLNHQNKKNMEAFEKDGHQSQTAG